MKLFLADLVQQIIVTHRHTRALSTLERESVVKLSHLTLNKGSVYFYGEGVGVVMSKVFHSLLRNKYR